MHCAARRRKFQVLSLYFTIDHPQRHCAAMQEDPFVQLVVNA